VYRGVQLRYFKTVNHSGFDTLLHSLKSTFDIIRHNTAGVVHIQNGGNSIFGVVLRIAGKRVFLSQDGVDWKRDKWPSYAKLYLWLSTFITAYGPTKVIFDNIFARDIFDERFPSRRSHFEFIPFGSDPPAIQEPTDILAELGIESGGFFLFVGRFIPDKGLQYLIPAFERVPTERKLVLVGGSPNPSAFEAKLRSTRDPRIVFAGFRYGSQVADLMRNAYAYVQPSDIEGLSPVILDNMGLGTPVICSDIRENLYVVGDAALTFRQGDIDDLAGVLAQSLTDPAHLSDLATRARLRAHELFSWDSVVERHLQLFEER
jgi:glycosyltransferase involved in cell wall biosynthesis